MTLADVPYDSRSGFDCSAPSYVGPAFVLLGVLALLWGAVAWNWPLPKALHNFVVAFAPDEIDVPGSDNWKVVRFLGPFNGTAFTLLGSFITWGKLHCGTFSFALPNIVVPIAFSSWLGSYVFAGIAAGITFWNTRGMAQLRMRIVIATWMSWIGFASGQSVGFHLGIHAIQWGAIALGSFMVVPLVGWTASWIPQRNGDGK